MFVAIGTPRHRRQTVVIDRQLDAVNQEAPAPGRTIFHYGGAFWAEQRGEAFRDDRHNDCNNVKVFVFDSHPSDASLLEENQS
ncbi:hypothetical protein Mal15_15780 [Stieleria maiorica]|uniref:Uncharacterized protein n=1 Tax=Stieleria maiorica TaxID=2795974 RepID=A0A5B9M8Q8_9BACT|nr:hypothetical protein [Stieleria maiorica]QEF97538.1 hypothetical protein Mal15_15780 [Stieleria maiorica]